MTTSTTVQRPDTHDMIVVHRVFRRESALMPALIQAAPPGPVILPGLECSPTPSLTTS